MHTRDRERKQSSILSLSIKIHSLSLGSNLLKANIMTQRFKIHFPWPSTLTFYISSPPQKKGLRGKILNKNAINIIKKNWVKVTLFCAFNAVHCKEHSFLELFKAARKKDALSVLLTLSPCSF